MYVPTAAGTVLGRETGAGVFWMHWLPNAVALIVPVYGGAGFGRRRRRSPMLTTNGNQYRHVVRRRDGVDERRLGEWKA